MSDDTGIFGSLMISEAGIGDLGLPGLVAVVSFSMGVAAFGLEDSSTLGNLNVLWKWAAVLMCHCCQSF